MHDPSTLVFALLALAALVAGFVDAVVGGGGLIQLPALALAFPVVPPVQVVATNKLSSICGTTVSAATYYRRIRPDPRTFGPLMVLSFVGSLVGAVLASHLSRTVFDPIVLAVLVLVGAYVVLRPRIGEETALRWSGRRHLTAALAAGFVIGVYDGALGPGTGSFFVVVLVGLLGYSFLEGTAKARLANWATNLAALCIFVPEGVVMWRVGIVMGAANLVGGYVGARTAVARGSRFVRLFFVAVVAALAVRIAVGLIR